MTTDIAILGSKVESQTFDRKSARIDAKALAVVLIAMANADGGTVAIGIEDNGCVTGIDRYLSHINDLLRVPMDYCVPTLDVKSEYVSCKNELGEDDHILLLNVEQSLLVHANTADEAFIRVGDKSHKLGFEERMQLTFAKGVCYFEDEPISEATIDDIDLAYVEEYCRKIGYDRDALTYLRKNKGFVKQVNGRERVSGAAILLFGNRPQDWFQRARVRVIRYDGTQELTGASMNVVKDEIFEGRIIEMTQNVLGFVKTQINEHTFLGEGAIFRTIPDYPEFCWTELIVNAIAHRDYSIMGTDIQVKLFTDHLTVESPGILPGTVRLGNLRTTHFSRNPKIAQVLHEYGFVREFGEGIDRIYREMTEAGLPAPEFRQYDFILRATIKKIDGTLNGISNGTLNGISNGTLNNTQRRVLAYIQETQGINAQAIINESGIPRDTLNKVLKYLVDKGYIERRGSKKTGGYFVTIAGKSIK